MKLIRIYFSWLCLGVCTLVLSLPAFCQSDPITLDSLKWKLSAVKEDTTRVQLYLDIGSLYEGDKLDSAMYYFQQSGKLSKKMNYPAGIIKYIAYYTETLNHQGKYDQALKMNLEAVEIARKHGLKLQLAKSLVNVAVSYQYKAEFENCLSYYLKAIPLFEELNFEDGLYTLYSNLCALYGQTLKEYDKALHYGKKALNLAKSQGNLYGVALAQINNGIVLDNKKEFAEALQANEEAYGIGRKINNLYLQKSALMNTGDIYIHQRQYSKVIPVANQALQLSKTLGDIEGEAIALGGLASAYLHAKDFTRAKHYATQAVALCRTHYLRDELGSKILQLAHIELALGNITAYENLQTEGDSLEEAIFNDNIRLNLQELETRYESAKKENQIRQLQKEKQIQVLTIREKNIINSVFVGITILLVAFGLLFYRNTRNQKIILQQTQKLQEQRIKELEQAQQLLAANAMLQGQEAERSRLARDLHDGIGGMLSGIKLSLSGIESNLILSERDLSVFSKTLEQLDNTIQELRRVAHNMMPEALARFGLLRAIHDFCNGMARSAKLAIDIQTFGMENRLDTQTEIVLYRIIQELLNNVVKHAQATEVLLQLVRTEENVTLTVEDNGKGFDAAQLYNGIGLKNIQSRINFLGGQLDIHSTPAVGTTITVDFMLQKSGIPV